MRAHKPLSTNITCQRENGVIKLLEDGSTPALPVKNFTSLNLGFNTFNPLQSRLVLEKLHIRDVNLLACWPTSAGKTVIAELITEQTLNRKLKVIYTCPLKSLAEEKVTRFKQIFPDYRIEIFTGDYQEVEKRRIIAENADVLVVTTELLDSISRNRKFSRKLFNHTGTIIIDEAHILGTERGPTVEASLIRITTINPDIKLILLSATLSNAEEVAEWLYQLNNKPTCIFESSWRPVKINWHTIPVNMEEAFSYPEKINLLIREAIATVTGILEEEPNSSILFFVWTRNEGRIVVEELKNYGIPCNFHNASLDLKQRLSLENAFNNGTIKVLVSTTTLAWGRNTCANHVIILGTRRGFKFVPSWDVIQAGGRAGRTGLVKSKEGHVWWFYPYTPQDEDFVYKTLSEVPPVKSFLTSPDHLTFHLLGEIPYKKEVSATQLIKWYKKTLAHKQFDYSTRGADIMIEAIEKLMDLSCIRLFPEKGTLTLTALGNVARCLYFNPAEVKCFLSSILILLKIFKEKQNFAPDTPDLKTFFTAPLNKEKLGIASILFLSHLKAKNDFYLSSSEKDELPFLESSPLTKKFFPSFLSSCFLSHLPEKVRYLVYKWLHWYEIHSQALVANEKNRPRIYWRLRDILLDLNRITVALSRIAGEVMNISFLDDFLNQSLLLLKTGAPIETVHLLKIKGIGPVRAVHLFKMGITSPQQLREEIISGKNSQIKQILPDFIVSQLIRKEKEGKFLNKR